MLAREVARTGFNRVMSEARRNEAMARENGQRFSSVKQFVGLVNGLNDTLIGTFEGGTYKARLEMASPGSYSPISEGYFGDASHRIGQEGVVALGMLQVPTGGTYEYKLKARFIESMAGYCSAVYLQRVLPDVEDDQQPTPELIFSSGKNRDGAEANYERTLAAGTQMNFLLAVDQRCNLQGRDVPITHSKYNYTQPALDVEAGRLEDMKEGKYAMLEEHASRRGVWRVAFEDLRKFSDKQHADVKKNSYGDARWKKRRRGKRRVYTYGGSGWSERDALGYYKLSDYGNLPDFSDQVFEIELVKVEPVVASGDGDD